MIFLTFFLAAVNAYMSFDLTPMVEEFGHLRKRFGSETDVFNQNVYYTINLQVGSNRQNISVRLDTRGGHLWIPASGGNIVGGYQCSSTNIYFPEDLLTFQNETSFEFSANYSGLETVFGYSANDTIYLGGQEHHQVFGAATNSTCIGMLGLGFKAAPYVDFDFKWSFPTFLWNFAEGGTGFAYSIYLGPNSVGEGKLYLGTVDLGKYDGKLWIVQMVEPRVGNNIQTDIVILLDGILGEGFSIPIQIPVTIALASTFLLLPYENVKNVGKQLGAVEESRNFHRLDCELLNLTSLVSFYFSGAEIQVPIRDLIKQKNGQCYLSLEVAEFPSVLGLDILKSTYLVVGLGQRQVALGQAAVSQRSSTLEPISFTIPDVATPKYFSYTLAREKFSMAFGGAWSTYTFDDVSYSYLMYTGNRTVDFGGVVYLLTLDVESTTTEIEVTHSSSGNPQTESVTDGLGKSNLGGTVINSRLFRALIIMIMSII